MIKGFVVNVPTADTRNMKVGGNLRPIPIIEPEKEVADSRHAWWPIVAGLPSGEGAISGTLAGTSQISDALRAGWLRESLSLTCWNSENRVLIFPIHI
jgi:hypothetical protein